VGFWRSVHKKCKVFNHILEILAIFSQGRNQFFPIVMRAGRDFKGGLINFCLIISELIIQTYYYYGKRDKTKEQYKRMFPESE
ncbi:hypothetical protein, partial [Fibrobacter intestinalis]|uniref:hypothetical protein n=1 Tax=Fibrobacter intestinalis TaxID=28122 RepID=UPI001F29CCD7